MIEVWSSSVDNIFKPVHCGPIELDNTNAIWHWKHVYEMQL